MDGPEATGVLEDRRRRQAAFPEAGDRFRTSYADSPLGLALLTPDGELFHANPALCRLLATAESDLLSRAFLDFVAAEDLSPAEDAIAATAAEGGELRSCSVRMVAGDGRSRWVELTVRTVAARDGAPLFVVVHIDDRTAEVEAIAALGHAERVVLAGRLASGVIHDVRNALAALQGRAELLAAELDDAGAARSHLDSMHSAMRRVTSLTGQVLELTKPAAPQRELVDLAGIVTAFEAVARAQFDDHSRVEIDAAEPVLLNADPAEVERILLTLFNNAAHAVAEGGEIRIAVSRLRRPAHNGSGGNGSAGNGCGRKGSRRNGSDPLARLVVEDTGVGMDEQTAAMVFEPFFSTKGAHGTGLGLASARTVVQRLGGSITIESAPRRGTTVEVLLPAVDPD